MTLYQSETKIPAKLKETDGVPLFCACADLHRTNVVPVCRQHAADRFAEEQDRKLSQIVAFTRRWGGGNLLVAGDMFDTWKCGHDVVNTTMALLKGVLRPHFAYGQHELPSHDIGEIWRSPVTTMNIVASPLLYTADGMYVRIDICNWGQKVQIDSAKHKRGTVRVLLMHKTVWKDERPYPGCKGNVEKLITKPRYKQYHVIITGDNHKRFMHYGDGTLWVNCGCVLRTSSAEKEYEPSVYLVYWSRKEKRCRAIRCVLDYEPSSVSGSHLEAGHARKEWDSEYVKSLAAEKDDGKRVVSFSERLRRSCEGIGHGVARAAGACVEDDHDILPF